VVGGSHAVSDQLFSELSTLAPATKLFGADRYATSVAVNSAAFPDASDSYLAAGSSFADGLTGGAVAAAKGSPMFLVRSTCVPQAAIGQIVTWGVTSVTVLGGTAAIGSGAQILAPC
jgi:putative cell wall-binding protein